MKMLTSNKLSIPDWNEFQDLIASIFKKMIAELPPHSDKIRMCLAETIGTGMLVFFGCMSCVGFKEEPLLLNITVAFGLTVMLVIASFGHISFAHINPAVTLSAMIFGSLPVLMGPLYMVSQTIGAIIGMLLLKLVTPEKIFADGATVCVTSPNNGVSPIQGLMVEFLCTSALIAVCCGVWDHRNESKGSTVALTFGLTITGLATVGGPYTGCSMNPARSFAPALVAGAWKDHWIYWIGPLLAAVTVTFLYNFVFKKKPEEITHDPAEGIALTDRREYNKTISA